MNCVPQNAWMRSRCFTVVFLALAWMLLEGCTVLSAEELAVCGTNGYRVVARHWDTVLKRGWETREECAHPGWPSRLVAMTSGETEAADNGDSARLVQSASIASESNQSPLLVKAGDVVRVWMQSDMVRIEMAGIVERSAHQGERVVIQITRQDDETGLTVQRINGRVTGAEEVEMER